MALWEHEHSRINRLILKVSRQEIETDDISIALAKLNNLLEPNNAKKFKGLLTCSITGYANDQRDLWEITEVKAWMRKLDIEWPYWFYFMDTSKDSTLSLIAFSLCRWEKVPSGKIIPPNELQQFLMRHFIAMNDLTHQLGESKEDQDFRSRSITEYFFPELAHSTSEKIK